MMPDTVVAFAAQQPAGGLAAPAPSHVHIYVEDVDAVHEQALAAGAESIQEPMQQSEEEDRRAGVKDDGGTTWWIARKVG